MGLLDAVSKPCLMSRTTSLGRGVTASVSLSECGPVMHWEVLEVRQETLVAACGPGW